jgi:hypothetical protein
MSILERGDKPQSFVDVLPENSRSRLPAYFWHLIEQNMGDDELTTIYVWPNVLHISALFSTNTVLLLLILVDYPVR